MSAVDMLPSPIKVWPPPVGCGGGPLGDRGATAAAHWTDQCRESI
jgi:hypothetical protein